jgi:ubiquinone biosynthesis protein UbiJ
MTFKSPNVLVLLDLVADKLGSRLNPPDWLTQEAIRRLLSVVNHVLMQEPAATERLCRQSGRHIQLHWRELKLSLRITPAGLVEVGDPLAVADLSVQFTQAVPSELAAALMSGTKPQVRIEGDVQLAAELNWIADHVRWDLEHDLARLFGDVPAHALVTVAKGVLLALRRFVASAPWRPASESRAS